LADEAIHETFCPRKFVSLKYAKIHDENIGTYPHYS